MKPRRFVVLCCVVAIAGVPAIVRAQFTYQPPPTWSQDTVSVWNDFHGYSGTAPIAIYSYGSWQTVPWPPSSACGGGLYSQQPYPPGFVPTDWQLGSYGPAAAEERAPAYWIHLGQGDPSITNNRLELNSSPGPTPPLGTFDTCHFLFEPASICTVQPCGIPSAYFKWSTYIPDTCPPNRCTNAITDGVGPNRWGGALFQMHPVDNNPPPGAWPGLTIEIDGSNTPWLIFTAQCTDGTPGCRRWDAGNPYSTMLDWQVPLSDYVGHWHDFAFYINLSTGADGVQTLWVDGVQVITWNGPNMYSSPSGHPRLNVQHGYYRLSSANSDSPLFQTPLLYSTTAP